MDIFVSVEGEGACPGFEVGFCRISACEVEGDLGGLLVGVVV